MKLFFFSLSGIFRPEVDIIFSRAAQALNEGKEVSLFFCEGVISCPTNPLEIKSVCALCRERTNTYSTQLRNMATVLNRRLTIDKINLSNIRKPRDSFITGKATEIRDVRYRGHDSGYAVLSTYIDLTRDFEPTLHRHRTAALLESLHTGFILTFEAASRLLANDLPDEVHIFNGRLSTSRAVFRAAKELGVTVRCHEFVRGSGRLESFENCLPHDLNENRRRIEELYKQKIAVAKTIAAEYYDSKIHGNAKFEKNFVAGQASGVLPSNWRSERRNVVIYSSSEDEFQAIGKEWEDRLFRDQISGVEKICEILGQTADIYLRIHPNVAGASRKYRRKLDNLKRLDNLVIIEPKSRISSYALLENCDTVITFGSSISIEAAYNLKPTIVLGTSFCSELGAVYRPKNIKELTDLLSRPSLKSLPSSPAAEKYAVYVTERGEEKNGFFSVAEEGNYRVAGNVIRFNRFSSLRYILTRVWTRIVLQFIAK